MNFEQIVGNPIAISMLQNIIASDNVAPAYLFTGKLGIGKFKTAKVFAQQLVKSDVEMLIVEPQQLEGSNAMPLLRIEQIHEIIEFCAIKPAIGKRKAIIINAFTGLSEKCGNALLKTLEEPSPEVTIILISNHDDVLPTIKSRCHHIPFKHLTNNEVIQVLSNLEHNDVSNIIIDAASGSVGKALQLIKAWDKISHFIEPLSIPPAITSVALDYCNQIVTLDNQTQTLLLQLLASIWSSQHNTKMLHKATTAMSYIKCKVSARAIWDELLIPASL